MNTVNLIGRLCKEIEVRTTPNDVSVSRFTLAVPRAFIKQGEERQTDFISCVAFGRTAEFLQKYFSKGSQVALTGHIQTGKYEKDGQRVYTTDLIVEKVFFAGNKTEKQEETSDALEIEQPKDKTYKSVLNMLKNDADDDLPF